MAWPVLYGSDRSRVTAHRRSAPGLALPLLARGRPSRAPVGAPGPRPERSAPMKPPSRWPRRAAAALCLAVAAALPVALWLARRPPPGPPDLADWEVPQLHAYLASHGLVLRLVPTGRD